MDPIVLVCAPWTRMDPFRCADQESGKVKASHLGDAMRSAGMNPTNAEVQFGSALASKGLKNGKSWCFISVLHFQSTSCQPLKLYPTCFLHSMFYWLIFGALLSKSPDHWPRPSQANFSDEGSRTALQVSQVAQRAGSNSEVTLESFCQLMQVGLCGTAFLLRCCILKRGRSLGEYIPDSAWVSHRMIANKVCVFP